MVRREQNDCFFFFFRLPVLPQTASLAEPAGTTICLAVPSVSNCQQHYVQGVANPFFVGKSTKDYEAGRDIRTVDACSTGRVLLDSYKQDSGLYAYLVENDHKRSTVGQQLSDGYTPPLRVRTA